jgi:hypothetical protein
MISEPAVEISHNGTDPMVQRSLLGVTVALVTLVGCQEGTLAPESELKPSESASESLLVVEFEIECEDTQILIGQSVQCVGWYYPPFPQPRIDAGFGWISADPAIASVTLGGVVTGEDEGLVEISAIAHVNGQGYSDQIEIEVDSVPPPPPLQVTIQGPEDIHPFSSSCGWLAYATGGAGGKTYQWYRDGVPVSTSASYMPSAPYLSDFELFVEVEDSAGGYDFGWFSVNSDLTAPYC